MTVLTHRNGNKSTRRGLMSMKLLFVTISRHVDFSKKEIDLQEVKEEAEAMTAVTLSARWERFSSQYDDGYRLYVIRRLCSL